MISPPILVSKGNVMIGYNPIYEYAALPDVERIVAALKRSTLIGGSATLRVRCCRVVIRSGGKTRTRPAKTEHQHQEYQG